jgi:uncharacterized membrane protein
MADFGVAGAIIGTVSTYIHHLAFDTALLRLTGQTQKSLPRCAFHAVVFELVLLARLMPVIACHLGVGLLHALAVDVASVCACMIYAFVFIWAYHRVYRLPASRELSQPSPVAL